MKIILGMVVVASFFWLFGYGIGLSAGQAKVETDLLFVPEPPIATYTESLSNEEIILRLFEQLDSAVIHIDYHEAMGVQELKIDIEYRK